MDLPVNRFRRLLFVSCASLATSNLMDITDSVIAGRLLGETALGAIELFWPCVEFLSFAATVIAGGTAILYANAIGRFRRDRARSVFTTGLVCAVFTGLAAALLLFLGREPFIGFFGASPQVRAFLDPYWTGFTVQAALYPVAVYLTTLVCSDGDERTGYAAFSAELVVNAVSSWFLCRAFGALGCALGTAAGTLAALSVSLLHFRRGENTLALTPRLSPRLVPRILWADLPASCVVFFTAAVYLLMNKVLLDRFGESSLTVMSVIVASNGLAVFLYGIPKAVQPLVCLFFAAGDTPTVRRLMHDALRAAVLLGFAVSLAFLAFPEFPARVLGVSSPELLAQCRTAVRIIAFLYPPMAVCGLFISYFLYIRRPLPSFALVALQEGLFPAVGCVLGASAFGFAGFWTGYAAAPFIALATVFAARRLFLGTRDPLALPHDRDAYIFAWNLPVEPNAVCRVAETAADEVRNAGGTPGAGFRVSMFIEESLMIVKEHNGNRPVNAFVSLDMNKGCRLAICDDGVVFDVAGTAVPGVEPLRGEMLQAAADAAGHRSGASVGFNRNVYEITL